MIPNLAKYQLAKLATYWNSSMYMVCQLKPDSLFICQMRTRTYQPSSLVQSLHDIRIMAKATVSFPMFCSQVHYNFHTTNQWVGVSYMNHFPLLNSKGVPSAQGSLPMQGLKRVSVCSPRIISITWTMVSQIAEEQQWSLLPLLNSM